MQFPVVPLKPESVSENLRSANIEPSRRERSVYDWRRECDSASEVPRCARSAATGSGHGEASSQHVSVASCAGRHQSGATAPDQRRGVFVLESASHASVRSVCQMQASRCVQVFVCIRATVSVCVCFFNPVRL